MNDPKCGTREKTIIILAGQAKPSQVYLTYPWIQIGEGLDLLKGVVDSILAVKARTRKPEGRIQPLWTHPMICQYIWYRLRYSVK